MMKHASVRIVLDKELFYGGDCLEGIARLKVKKSEVITYMQVQIHGYKCVNIHVEDIRSNNYSSGYGNSNIFNNSIGGTREFWYSENLFNTEATIFSEPKLLEEGTHALPFKVLLPSDLPPSVRDYYSSSSYGKNVYQVTVRLGRKKHGTFSRRELTDRCKFSYSPVQYVDDFNLPEQTPMEYRFSDYLHSKGFVGSMKNSIGHTAHDPSSMINIIFTFPAQGLRQDIGNRFNVVVFAPPNTRPILVSHVRLDIEATSRITVQNKSLTEVTQKANLVDRRMSQEGTVVDLGPMLLGVRPNMHLVPSFMSPCHNHTTKLYLHLTVKQAGPEGPRIAHVKTSVDLNVLSGRVTQTPKMIAPPPY